MPATGCIVYFPLPSIQKLHLLINMYVWIFRACAFVGMSIFERNAPKCLSHVYILLWWFQLQRKPTCIIVFFFILFRINCWSAHHIYLARTENTILLTLLPHLWHCKNVYGCTAYDNRCEMIFRIPYFLPFLLFTYYLFVVRWFTIGIDFLCWIFPLFIFSFFPIFSVSPYFVVDEFLSIESNECLRPVTDTIVYSFFFFRLTTSTTGIIGCKIHLSIIVIAYIDLLWLVSFRIISNIRIK